MSIKRDLEIVIGWAMCRMGRHDWVFVRRRLLNNGTHTHRTDECSRCGALETWCEVDGVKQKLADEEW